VVYSLWFGVYGLAFEFGIPTVETECYIELIQPIERVQPLKLLKLLKPL
jgi:hypothetical protein